MDKIFETNKGLLKSMLLDEEKLITYVSLSKDLCVHVNNSKLLLLRLVDSIRQEQPDLQINVCYIISGATKNNNSQTIVCPEQELSTQKEYFSNIFFEHIYSVSVGSSNIDTVAYLSVNKYEDFALCSGLIKSNVCNKRTSVEISNLKTNSQEIVPPEKSKSLPVPLKKVKQETDTVKNGHSDINSIPKHNESKSDPTVKQEVLSPKKEATVNNKLKISSSNNHRMQKGIAGFFNKPVKKEMNKKPMINNEAAIELEKSNKKDVNVEVVVQSPEVAKLEEQTEKDTKRNVILNEIKKTSKVDKKRKRVLHVSDSDSDNENNDPFTDSSVVDEKQNINHESDDEIPPTPSTNSIKITSSFVNPKKRRKIVDKTYTDEDGYILTKKEEVYESCSEEEEIKTVEKPEPKQVKAEVSPKEKISKPKKKVSPPQKGKQPMMTNFFKKI